LAPRARAAALERARQLADIVNALKAEGKGVRQIADILNERGLGAAGGIQRAFSGC
jgi:hypothetical protein